MSRLSRANIKARESIFTTGPNLYRTEALTVCPPDLEECVAAMEDCCEEVHSNPAILHRTCLTRRFRHMKHNNSLEMARVTSHG